MLESFTIVYDPFSGAKGVDPLTSEELVGLEKIFSGSFTRGKTGPLYNDPLDFENLLSGGLPGTRIHAADAEESLGIDLLTLVRRLRASGIYAQRGSVSVGPKTEEYLLLNTSQFREKRTPQTDAENPPVLQMPKRG